MGKINFIMKRGISPLLSYVFLIALVVSIAMIVTSTLIERAQNIDIEERIDYCEDVSISLDFVCRENGVLKMNITNNGAFSVYKVTLGKETNISSYQWCVYPEPYSFFPLNNGDTKEVPLSINATFVNAINESLSECHAVNMGTTVGVAEVSIIPWIKPEPEGEIFPCTQKKLVWDQDLNNIC